MQTTHSFFVPELAYLTDAKGLFACLQEKVCRDHICIACDRAFGSLEACRKHMRDKSHCRIDLDSAEALEELGGFYDLARLRDRFGSSAFANGAFVDRSGEVVLRNGTRPGHRCLQPFYKQKFRSEDTRLAVQLNRTEQRQRPATASDHLGGRLALREEAKRRNGVLVRSAAVTRGTSKAIASTFIFKADVADNKHARALQHHGYGGFGGGAHYTMAGSKQFQKGVRVKGVISRHSVQGARLQASRNKANRGDSSVAVKR